MNSKTKILVTGSSGMIGTALCEALKDDYDIMGVDINPQRILTEVQHKKVDLRDLLEFEQIEYIPDMVIHLAANARVNELTIEPKRALDNIIMTHNILDWCRLNEVKNFIFASSRETYGNQGSNIMMEFLASQRQTESVYAASKIAGEAYCYAYRESFGIKPVIVRLSNVYGKYDNSDRFIPKAIQTLSQNKPFEIYGEDKILDFTYIDDCVEGIKTLVENWRFLAQTEYNIASGESTKLVDVANRLKTLLSSESEITISKSHPGEVQKYYSDISRMKKTGWKPKVGIEEGLTKSISYYATQPVS